MSLSLKDFEIMAPVGSRESLAAAIQAGAAAAVYLFRYRKLEYACPFGQYVHD